MEAARRALHGPSFRAWIAPAQVLSAFGALLDRSQSGSDGLSSDELRPEAVSNWRPMVLDQLLHMEKSFITAIFLQAYHFFGMIYHGRSKFGEIEHPLLGLIIA